MREREPSVVVKKNRLVNRVIEGIADNRISLNIEGEENIQAIEELLLEGKPIQLWANHLSNADAPAIMLALRECSPIKRVTWVMGDVIKGNLITRIARLAYRGVEIPSQRLKPEEYNAAAWKLRNARSDKSFDQSKLELEMGNILGVFAEASRSRTKAMREVKGEVAKYLYFVPDTYIVPVGVWGTEILLPPEKFIPAKGPAWVNFGKPISVSELEDNVGKSIKPEDNLQKLADEVMRNVALQLPEEYRGYYGDS